MTTDNTATTIPPDEYRDRLTERMDLIERTLHNITTPGVLSREDQLAIYRELHVNARSEARSRLRTEWTRLKNYVELLDERQEREAKSAS